MFGSQGASSSPFKTGGPSLFASQQPSQQATAASPSTFAQPTAGSSSAFQAPPAASSGSLFGSSSQSGPSFGGFGSMQAQQGQQQQHGLFGSSSTPSQQPYAQQQSYFGSQVNSATPQSGYGVQFGTPGSSNMAHAGFAGTPGGQHTQQAKRSYLPGYLSGGVTAQTEMTPPQSTEETKWDSPARRQSFSGSPATRFGSQGLFANSVKESATPSRSPKAFGRGGSALQRTAEQDDDAPPISSLGDMEGNDSLGGFNTEPLNQSTSGGAQNSNSQSANGYAINVFGFPSSALDLVLEYFAQFGDVVATTPSSEGGNWVTIVYAQAWSAFRAARKNGEVLGGALMIGVKAVDEDHLRQAVASNENGGGSASDKLDVAAHNTTSSQSRVSLPSATPSGKQSNVLGPDSAFKPTPPRRGLFGGAPGTANVKSPLSSSSSADPHASLFAEKSRQAVLQQQGQQHRGLLGKVSDAVFGW
ncbi:hypothetical protein OIV83_002974 [Microbotryomycetes sp. JL201]|nr:hypothetical protein OIV83_002974 [Microbotryomycetes sp. JL201]